MTETMPGSSCEDLHPGQTHDEWNASFDSAPAPPPQLGDWKQRIHALDVDPTGFVRVVVETSDDGAEPYNRDVIARGDDAVDLLDTISGAVWQESAREWFEREQLFAADAHELTPDLVGRISAIFVEGGPTEEQYARAAQLIACTRNTCGGPAAGHDHIT